MRFCKFLVQPIKSLATVTSITLHTRKLISISLETEKNFPKLIPGQFIHLTLDDYLGHGYWPESRVFSVSNAVLDRRTIKLTISEAGFYTNRIINEISVGRKVWVKGPYGDFNLENFRTNENVMFIAGGSGITPFCSFIDKLLEDRKLDFQNLFFVYGARDEKHLIYRSYLKKFEKQFANVQTFIFLENLTHDRKSGDYCGRISLPKIEYRINFSEISRFYLSGPKPMIETTKADLTEIYQVDRDKIYLDDWS